jgi:putative exporter of polyketide antibiotics
MKKLSNTVKNYGITYLFMDNSEYYLIQWKKWTITIVTYAVVMIAGLSSQIRKTEKYMNIEIDFDQLLGMLLRTIVQLNPSF